MVRSSSQKGRVGVEGTDVAMGDLSDGSQDYCACISTARVGPVLARALTVPLGIQNRDHGGRWAGGRVVVLAER